MVGPPLVFWGVWEKGPEAPENKKAIRTYAGYRNVRW